MQTTAVARSGWVLDLRSPEFGGETGPGGLRLTNTTASGSAHGYRIETQRRSRDGHLGVCIRLTAPDGRTLDTVGYASSTDTNARGPASSTLSRSVAWAFKTNPTAEQARIAADRIAAVIDTGLDCLRDGISGRAAHLLIQCAAEDVALADAEVWLSAFPQPSGEGSYLRVREIAWLIETGFTPETAAEWFAPSSCMVGTKAYAEAMAAFRDHDWPIPEARHFVRTYDTTTAPRWAPVGWNHCELAMRAGLTPRAAKRLLHRDEWDERALETLAALRA